MKNLPLLTVLILFTLACSLLPSPAVGGGLPSPNGEGDGGEGATPLPVPTEAATTESHAATSLRAAFFAVHIETSDHSVYSNSVAVEWTMLADMVSAFESRGHRLTLEFQPQWAEYALEHAEALAQVRDWEAHGHEIAFHHHGLAHPAWDGFTNLSTKSSHPKYRGDMALAFSLVSQLPSSGLIQTAGMTDEDTDWPAGVIYATGGQGMSGGEVLSTPHAAVYNGQAVTEISYQAYALTRQKGQSISLAEIESALQTARPDEILGLVTHPYDFAANPDAFQALFDLLERYGVTLQTVSKILESN